MNDNWGIDVTPSYVVVFFEDNNHFFHLSMKVKVLTGQKIMI